MGLCGERDLLVCSEIFLEPIICWYMASPTERAEGLKAPIEGEERGGLRVPPMWLWSTHRWCCEVIMQRSAARVPTDGVARAPTDGVATAHTHRVVRAPTDRVARAPTDRVARTPTNDQELNYSLCCQIVPCIVHINDFTLKIKTTWLISCEGKC